MENDNDNDESGDNEESGKETRKSGKKGSKKLPKSNELNLRSDEVIRLNFFIYFQENENSGKEGDNEKPGRFNIRNDSKGTSKENVQIEPLDKKKSRNEKENSKKAPKGIFYICYRESLVFLGKHNPKDK